MADSGNRADDRLRPLPEHDSDTRGDRESTPESSQRRIEELEAELATGRAMIRSLINKLERTRSLRSQTNSESGGDSNATSSELKKRLRQRTRALEESEKQLESKSLELERLNEMKVEFISIATHELRTPLTSIVGYLDLLEEGRFGDVPESMERPMASLRRNAHRLKRLVDEMLDVSRIDSGRVTLYRTRCSLPLIVDDIVADLRPQAAAKRQELNSSVDDPPEIYADIDKIKQVASKVIANAIRHTPEAGIVTIILDTAPPERYAGVWARLRIKGTGITIPSEMRSRIFEPFAAVHKAKHHTSAGPDAAGLGLYIARGLVDLHGGLISVDSVEGAYTEFTVLLPESEPTDIDS